MMSILPFVLAGAEQGRVKEAALVPGLSQVKVLFWQAREQVQQVVLILPSSLVQEQQSQLRQHYHSH